MPYTLERWAANHSAQGAWRYGALLKGTSAVARRWTATPPAGSSPIFEQWEWESNRQPSGHWTIHFHHRTTAGLYYSFHYWKVVDFFSDLFRDEQSVTRWFNVLAKFLSAVKMSFLQLTEKCATASRSEQNLEKIVFCTKKLGPRCVVTFANTSGWSQKAITKRTQIRLFMRPLSRCCC